MSHFPTSQYKAFVIEMVRKTLAHGRYHGTLPEGYVLGPNWVHVVNMTSGGSYFRFMSSTFIVIDNGTRHISTQCSLIGDHDGWKTGTCIVSTDPTHSVGPQRKHTFQVTDDGIHLDRVSAL